MRLNTGVFSSLSSRSLVLGIVITAACLAFVFTGFGSLKFTGLTDLNPGTAAKVDGDDIDMELFASSMNEQEKDMKSSPLAGQRQGLAHQVINQLIAGKILEQYNQKIGWSAADVEVATFIRSIPAFKNVDTGQFDLAMLKNYLKEQGQSEIKFYAYLKRQMELQKILDLLMIPAPLSNQLFDIQYQIDNTEFQLQYAIVTTSEFPKDTKKIIFKNLKKHFKITDSFISELGPTNDLVQNIFKLKKPGDVLPKVLNFAQKKAIIKLVSLPVIPKKTEKEMLELKEKYLTDHVQAFASSMEQSLLSKYENEGKIKTNPVLFN